MIFSNPEFGEIRGIKINGEPWLVGKDIAAVLGYAKPENAIAAHVDNRDKTTTLIQWSGSSYKTTAVIINESGPYSLIFSSKLPGAEKFTHWVTSEVLPSIRKTGMYVPNPTASPYDVSALSPSLQVARMLSENINALLDSMARTELEQKRQAEEQARQAAEQACQAEEQKRMAQEQERQAAEQKRQVQEQEQQTEALQVEFIITRENATKSFDASEKSLDLITLFVKLLIVTPRIFTVAFLRNYGHIPEFRRESPRFVPFIGSIH